MLAVYWKGVFGLFALSGLLLSACSSATPTASAPAPAPQAAAPVKTVELKLAHHVPATQGWAMGGERWAKAVTEKSGGKVKVTVFPAGQLVKGPDTLDAVATGRVEAGLIADNYFGGAIPVLGMADLPFVMTTRDGYNKAIKAGIYDVFAKGYEMQNVVALAPGPTDWMVMFSSKPLAKPEDVKGQIIRVLGPPTAELVKLLGGSPNFMSSSEMYTGLQRKTIDGVITGNMAFAERKLQEVTKYAWEVPLLLSAVSLGINKNVWDGLSPDVQQLMRQAAWDVYFEESQRLAFEKSDEALVMMKKAGIEVTDPTPETIAMLRDKTAPIREAWAKQVGPVGQQMLDIAKKYNP